MIEPLVDDRLEMRVVRREGGSWATRIAALVLVCGVVGATLTASWKTISMPLGWAVLIWAGGLLAGVLATARLLRITYEVAVVSTWRDNSPLGHSADNRRWWLGRYTATMTWPYGILAVAAVFALRLSAGNKALLKWYWWLMIILLSIFAVLLMSGPIPKDPTMPDLKRLRIRLLPMALAVGIFVAVRLVGLTLLDNLLFVGVLFVVTSWTTFAVVGAAQLFLRVDQGQSWSYPINRRPK
jgi:hypothetical protein